MINMYIKIDTDNYITTTCTDKISDGMQMPISLPIDIDFDFLGCYKFIDDRILLDEQKKIEVTKIREQESINNEKLQLAEDTYKRLMSKFLASSASSEDAEALRPLCADT